MESLRNYLNSMTPLHQQLYATRCGTTVGYLRKAISLKQRLDGALARNLDLESCGAVSRGELRPDIWPELMESQMQDLKDKDKTPMGPTDVITKGGADV